MFALGGTCLVVGLIFFAIGGQRGSPAAATAVMDVEADVISHIKGAAAPETVVLIQAPEIVLDIMPIGGHTALVAEASDAGDNPDFLIDGQSGDVDFPFGNLKPIGTVGEYWSVDGKVQDVLVGVPDGMGAYLLDDDTVRVVVQSESYGPASQFESYPYPVNDGATTFTGSHVQYADYDREALSVFMQNDESAAAMVKDFGNLVKTAYNLKGELVGPRNANISEPTTVGAHFGNTDAEGYWKTTNKAGDGLVVPSKADWTMMSLCSAHLEEPHQWGEGIGVEDLLFLTVEEWTYLDEGVESYVGLSAHTIDPATETMYATGAFTMGGFEKIIEFSSGSQDYVAFSVSGYNGAFGDYDDLIAKRNEVYGNRTDNQPYVKPQNVVPARVYVGKKGYNEQGEKADDFLSRNGLRFGQMYGFAVDYDKIGARDTWHKTAMKGDTVGGAFYPIEWRWDGEVKDFIHDGSWDFQLPPVGAEDGIEFWNGMGKDKSGSKTEHNAPLLDGRTGFMQSSTAGYFGEYDLAQLASELSAATDFPAKLEATYTVFQGETPIVDLIDLGGKGLRADGGNQTVMTDKSGKTHLTFEDIDGFELVAAADGTYAVICEDGGNAFGERAFIVQVPTDDSPMDYKFIAQAGGQSNSRVLAGAGVPQGTTGSKTASEFSGTVDLSGMLKKEADGTFTLKAGAPGFEKHAVEATVPINDKYILIGLQGHQFTVGIVDVFEADRGGQWLIYQPALPMEETAEKE